MPQVDPNFGCLPQERSRAADREGSPPALRKPLLKVARSRITPKKRRFAAFNPDICSDWAKAFVTVA